MIIQVSLAINCILGGPGKSWASEMNINRSLGVSTILRCGILALGVVATGIESRANDAVLRVSETDETITIRSGEATVLTYRKTSPEAPAGVDAIYRRSGCLHPVSSPLGRTVTTVFPADHLHQHGVFTAWVDTTYDGQPVDFWNMAKGTGRVRHDRVISRSETRECIELKLDLVHSIAADPPVDVLKERWKITVHTTDGSYHLFDLSTTQQALTDQPLVINKYHYGGFAVRGPTRWLTPKDRDAKQPLDLVLEPSGFLNNLGSERVEGNHQHAKWVAMWGRIDDQPVSVAVLCHADNFRAPQAARLHPTKPYFCYAPCVDDAFTIDREHPYHATYRFLITDALPDAHWLDQQWAEWCGR